jgi:hypothetical protein
VSQVVNPDAWEAGGLAELVEVSQDVFGSEWLSVGAGEHEILVVIAGVGGEAL